MRPSRSLPIDLFVEPVETSNTLRIDHETVPKVPHSTRVGSGAYSLLLWKHAFSTPSTSAEHFDLSPLPDYLSTNPPHPPPTSPQTLEYPHIYESDVLIPLQSTSSTHSKDLIPTSPNTHTHAQCLPRFGKTSHHTNHHTKLSESPLLGIAKHTPLNHIQLQLGKKCAPPRIPALVLPFWCEPPLNFMYTYRYIHLATYRSEHTSHFRSESILTTTCRPAAALLGATAPGQLAHALPVLLLYLHGKYMSLQL